MISVIYLLVLIAIILAGLLYLITTVPMSIKRYSGISKIKIENYRLYFCKKGGYKIHFFNTLDKHEFRALSGDFDAYIINNEIVFYDNEKEGFKSVLTIKLKGV